MRVLEGVRVCAEECVIEQMSARGLGLVASLLTWIGTRLQEAGGLAMLLWPGGRGPDLPYVEPQMKAVPLASSLSVPHAIPKGQVLPRTKSCSRPVWGSQCLIWWHLIGDRPPPHSSLVK